MKREDDARKGAVIIKHELETITSQLARNFWDLRGKRLEAPCSKKILAMDDLEETLSQQLKKIEHLGGKIYFLFLVSRS